MSTRWHRARKEHVCTGCRHIIEPGEVYKVEVRLPGLAYIPIGGGDYDIEDYDFMWGKFCDDCQAEEAGYEVDRSGRRKAS